MAHEMNYVVIDAPARLAGKVVVTPATQPVEGLAEVRLANRQGRVKCCPSATVVGATLEFGLPRAARVGDTLFWTSYDT
jgi:hypothetical protein